MFCTSDFLICGKLRSIKSVHITNLLSSLQYRQNNEYRYAIDDCCFSSHACKDVYDVAVVGGGIVGVATARELQKKKPGLKICILEKENKLALHQTGHNSGVIHSGIYYKPGTLTARLCVEGLHLMYEYCNSKKIPYKKCGKLIVATNKLESERLEDLIERGRKNNVPEMKVIESAEIKKIEPYCQGLRAIWSPHTGIIDYALVTETLGKDFVADGGEIYLNFEVENFQQNIDNESESMMYPLKIVGKKQSIKSSFSIVCAGLYSDKLAVMTGCSQDPKIVPFRGEYLLLNDNKTKMVKGNIYPVPDPKFPFLGVHFTPRLDGKIWLGPNAVLAFKREGYRWRDFSLTDSFDAVSYPGFIKLAAKYFTFGAQETFKSIFISKQIRDLQKFIPDISVEDVKRGPAGVRAQALNHKGELVHDFVFDVNSKTEVGKRVLHCRNAPSPAATSSLAIAKLIVERIDKEFSIRNL